MNNPSYQGALQGGQAEVQGAQFAAEQRGQAGAQAQQAGQQIGQQLQQAQQFNRQMELQSAESAGHLQMWQSEQQLNMEKLRHMQALDLSEQTRLQVEGLRQQVQGATLHNQSVQFELDQKQKLMAGMTEQEQKLSRYLSLLHGVNPETLYEMGVGMDKQGRLTTELTDEDKQGMLKRIEEFGQSKMRPLADQTSRDMGAHTNAIREEAALLRDRLKSIQEGIDQKDPAALDEQKQIKQRQLELEETMRSYRTGGQAQHSQGTAADFGPTLEKSHPQLKEHLETALQRAGVKDIEGAKGRFWQMVQNEARLLQQEGIEPGDAMERALTSTLADVRNGIANTMGYIRGKK